MKLIIGLLGEKGAGKETVGDIIMQFFSNKKVQRVRSSDILGETLRLWGLPLNRHNLQHLAIIMNQGYGLGTLSEAVKKRIDSLDADIILFDGIRWDSDISLVRAYENNKLIYVTAPATIRFDRIKKRKEKAGEDQTTFEQFLEEEKVLTETKITTFGKQADYTFINDKGVEELKKSVEKVLVL